VERKVHQNRSIIQPPSCVVDQWVHQLEGVGLSGALTQVLSARPCVEGSRPVKLCQALSSLLSSCRAVELDSLTRRRMGVRGFSVEVCRGLLRSVVCRGLSRSVEVCRAILSSSCRAILSSSCRVSCRVPVEFLSSFLSSCRGQGSSASLSYDGQSRCS
jgi:hypothetical protein